MLSPDARKIRQYLFWILDFFFHFPMSFCASRSVPQPPSLPPWHGGRNLGDELSVSPELRKAQEEDDQMSTFQDAAFEDTRTMQEAEDKLRTVPSSSLVPVDKNGKPFLDRCLCVCVTLSARAYLNNQDHTASLPASINIVGPMIRSSPDMGSCTLMQVLSRLFAARAGE